MTTELIRYHVDGKVGVVTIDRPEKRNAMTYAMLGDFIETVGRADADPDTVVIVVTGVPGAFCAGTDLADLATVPGETRGLRGAAEDEAQVVADRAGSQADDRGDRRPGGRDGCRVLVAVRPPAGQRSGALRLELRPPRPGPRHRVPAPGCFRGSSASSLR